MDREGFCVVAFTNDKCDHLRAIHGFSFKRLQIREGQLTQEAVLSCSGILQLGMTQEDVLSYAGVLEFRMPFRD